jgi:hypothetical protein
MTTSSIGSNSRNYATIALWWAACPANLVTATQTWEGECYNDSEFSLSASVNFLGVTQNATYFAELRCAAGHSFTDHANKLTNALRYNQSNGVAITNSAGYARCFGSIGAYMKIIGLQIKVTSNSSCLYYLTGTVLNCILQTGASSRKIGLENQPGSRIINSCLIMQSMDNAVQMIGGTHYIKNCTIFYLNATSGSALVQSYTTSCIVSNCAIFNCTTAFSGTWGSGTDYNATSASSLPTGTHNLTSLTTADQFENVSSLSTLDLRAKSSGSLDGAGTRDQSYTNDLDIVGQSRSTSTPTIGAWEYVTGFSFLPVFNKKFITNNTLLRS